MRSHIRVLLATTVLGSILSTAFADPPTLNYQGRLTAGGADFTGEGYFKFVLTDGDAGLWSNDGSAGTNEPINCISNAVNNGFFTTVLGADWAGMHSIPPMAFHAHALWLRTWFATNNVGPFEMLQPDIDVRVMDFALFNTGDLVIVDDDGTADFEDPRDAIAYVMTNDRARTVLLMPGWYEVDTPLEIPPEEWITVKGVQQDYVSIVNSNGPAIRPFDGKLDNISLYGSPAIDDGGATNRYNLTLVQCRIEDYDDTASSTIDLSADGNNEHQIRAIDCELQNRNGEPILDLGGSVNFSASRCDFWSSDSVALQAESDQWGMMTFDGCRIFSSGDHTIQLTDWNGSLEAHNTQINSVDGAAIFAGLSEDATVSSRIHLDDCRIWSGTDETETTPTLECENLSTNDTDIEFALSETEVYASTGSGFLGTRSDFEMTGGSLEGSDTAASLINASFSAAHTELSGDSAGIRAINSELDLRCSEIEGNDAAVLASNCVTSIFLSDLSGETAALAVAGGNIMVFRSTLFSMGPAAMLMDDCRVATFENSQLFSVATNASVPVIQLGVMDGTNAPTTELLSCVVRGLAASNTVDLGGSATSGTVQIAGCILSSAMSTNITAVSGTQIYNSSVLMDVPFTLNDLFPGGMDDD